MARIFRKRNACFAVTTPYQIIGAVSIVKSTKIDADLYVFGMFEGYEKTAKRIRDLKIFKKVIAVDAGEYCEISRQKAMLQMVFASRTVSEFLPEDLCYEYFYSSSRAHIKTIMQHVLQSRYKNMKVVVFEDGLGSYIKDSHVLKATGGKSKAEKLLGWRLYDPDKCTVMGYIPELMEKPAGLESCTIEKMPRLDTKGADPELLQYIFGAGKDSMIDEPAIIFDIFRKEGESGSDKFRKLDECYEKAAAILGKDNVIIKAHPRTLDKTRADIKAYEGENLPMEVLYAGMKDPENRILISFASTAVYTPKMLYDKEPVIINLYGIMGSEDEISDYDSSAEKFGALYSDRTRIFRPGNMDELEDVLKGLAAEK